VILMFPSDMLKAMLHHKVEVGKVEVAEGTTDTEQAYGYQTRTVTYYTLECSLYPIRAKDLAYFPPGVLEQGDLRVFFMPYYSIDGTLVTVDTHDIILYNDNEYEIRNISDITDGQRVIMKEAFARRI